MLLFGNKLAEGIKNEIKREVSLLNSSVALAVLLVGEDTASKIYVSLKQKACEEVGIKSIIKKLPNTITTQDILTIIQEWNQDININGILIQLPLSKHINQFEVLNSVNPNKDVDGFHYSNLGRLVQGLNAFYPCTPMAIKYLLEKNDVKIIGSNVVIVNDTVVVGKPLAFMLLNDGATVTVCHRRTKNLHKITKSADILITAVGKRPDFCIKGEMVKRNSVIIDIGVSKVNDNIVGDVNFEEVKDKVRYITAIVGGVGPLTIAHLLQNTLLAKKKQAGF